MTHRTARCASSQQKEYPMITLKKNVSVDVDSETMKKLGRARKSLSELASAIIQAVDDQPGGRGHTSSR
jgi:hypothetical protein